MYAMRHNQVSSYGVGEGFSGRREYRLKKEWSVVAKSSTVPHIVRDLACRYAPEAEKDMVYNICRSIGVYRRGQEMSPSKIRDNVHREKGGRATRTAP